MKTEDLIHRLGDQLTPVRPLAASWKRAAIWLACGAVYIGIMMISVWLRRGSLAPIDGVVGVIEQLALISTALAASLAAFLSVVPGLDRRLLATPVVPAVVVMATLVWNCVEDLRRMGTLGLGRETDWPCVASLIVGGTALWALGVVMLRRGAPLAPRVSSMLAAVAALSLANVEACISQPHGFAITMVVWHGITTALLVMALMLLGRWTLTWVRQKAW